VGAYPVVGACTILYGNISLLEPYFSLSAISTHQQQQHCQHIITKKLHVGPPPENLLEVTLSMQQLLSCIDNACSVVKLPEFSVEAHVIGVFGLFVFVFFLGFIVISEIKELSVITWANITSLNTLGFNLIKIKLNLFKCNQDYS